MAIIVNLDVVLAQKKMSVTELSEKVGITMANISILKNGKAMCETFRSYLRLLFRFFISIEYRFIYK